MYIYIYTYMLEGYNPRFPCVVFPNADLMLFVPMTQLFHLGICHSFKRSEDLPSRSSTLPILWQTLVVKLVGLPLRRLCFWMRQLPRAWPCKLSTAYILWPKPKAMFGADQGSDELDLRGVSEDFLDLVVDFGAGATLGRVVVWGTAVDILRPLSSDLRVCSPDLRSLSRDARGVVVLPKPYIALRTGFVQ